MDFSERTISESDLAQFLGCARNDLRRIRAACLLPGIDWLSDEHTRAILITQSGIAKIRGSLRLPPEPVRLALPWQGNDAILSPGKKNGSRFTPLTVVKLTRFHRIIDCRDPSGSPARLRVRDSANFVPGMLVPTCVHEQADLYAYEGRLPRRKGRL
jgi:hypothetical protein